MFDQEETGTENDSEIVHLGIELGRFDVIRESLIHITSGLMQELHEKQVEWPIEGSWMRWRGFVIRMKEFGLPLCFAIFQHGQGGDAMNGLHLLTSVEFFGAWITI